MKICSEAKSTLIKTFYACAAIFPTYGKDSNEMKDALSIFQMCLADYSAEQIKKGFTTWLKSNKAFPTPCDIINIIERNGKPAFEKTIYISLLKKKDNNPDSMSKEEWQYIKEYENWYISGQYK